MPNIRWLLSLITRIHRFVYEKTDGRLGARLGGQDMLLLTTRGRKSGQLRTLPLLYIPDGERILIVGSNAGDDRPPAWWLNLQAKPEAQVRVGRERWAVSARRAEPDEALELWPKLLSSYPPYGGYRERTERDIPIVILERA